MGTRKFGGAELIKAAITRLSTHAKTSSYRVYSNIPVGTAMPYIRVTASGGVRSQFTSRDYEAEENTLTLQLYSDYKGDKEITQMIDNCIQALTSSTLSITGYTNPMRFLMDSITTGMVQDEADTAKLIRRATIDFTTDMTPTS